MTRLSRRGTRPATRRSHKAALAVTVDGDVLVNVACFDGSDATMVVLRRALAERGPVFVGVVLSTAERREVLTWLTNAAFEGVGYIIGRRQRRARRRA